MDADCRGGETDPPEALSAGALSERRCRYALYCLALRGRRMGLPDVADAVTEWEQGRPGEAIPRRRLRVYTSLYHDHLPQLEAAGLVEYSQADDAVELVVDDGTALAWLREQARAELPEN